MRDLTYDEFAATLGETWDMVIGGEKLPVVLDQAHPLPGSAREGGGFRLVFLGPFEPVAPQGLYPFERGSESHDIFIVPVAQVQDGIEYEAIFM